MDAVLEALGKAAGSGLMPRGASVLLAVSGGADSMALLYGAVEAAPDPGWKLAVGHVHHGWRAREADRDVAFVADHARRLGLPFHSRQCDARETSKRLGLSPEAGARHVRYAALHEMARECGAAWIATAHQHEDVVESHFLACERRGGPGLLAGPRERRGDGVVRPLLSVTRSEVLAFLSVRGIPFRRDASNGRLRLARNRVRRELARLRESPGGEETLRAVSEEIARLDAERRALEADFEARVLPDIHTLPGGAIADASALEGFPEELQRLALDRLAAPFARPGRPPLTGREREEVRRRLSAGVDFRFEAGRRIRFERRGRALTVTPREPVPV